jgi:hypothetical protein
MRCWKFIAFCGLAMFWLFIVAAEITVSAQTYQTKAILKVVGDSDITVLDTGSNGTITFTTDGVERVRIDSTGNVGIGKTPTTKLDVNGTIKATNLETQSGSYIHIYLAHCGGACGGSHPVSTWTDVGAQGYTWGVNSNTAPTVFTHNGTGRITVNKTGTYLIRLTTMAIPPADASNVMYACPAINGSSNCGNASGVNGLALHGYYPGGWWAKSRHDIILNLTQGNNVGYAYYPIQTLSYWAHDWYTALEITKIK